MEYPIPSAEQVSLKANSKPSAKRLQQHVTPRVAAKWYELGLELLDEKEECKLDIIESNYGRDVKKCCLEMFRLWLNTNSNANWWRIVEALKSPGVDLSSVAIDLEMKLVECPVTSQAMTDYEESATEPSGYLNFAEFQDVSLAFSTLLSVLQKEVNIKDFMIIRNACVARVNHKLGQQIKKTHDIDSLFQLFAENKAYCNWMNVRLLEVVANASGNGKLVNLVKNYKDKIYSKTLREVWDCIPYHTVRTKYYSKIQETFDGKNPDNVTIEQLLRYCEPYLIKDIAKHMLIGTIEEGSLKITWFIPTDKVHESYLSALMLPQESRLDSHLQIGDWVVYNPLLVLQKLQRECSVTLPFTLLVGYYYHLLLKHIDADYLISKMYSNGLLTACEEKLILTGHSSYHRGQLLLDHVRHMQPKMLVIFCEFVQEITPSVGQQLVTALQSYVTSEQPQSYTINESLGVRTVNQLSSLQILFFKVIDQIEELLHLCDSQLLTETCKNLKASEVHGINLFSNICIKNLDNYDNSFSLLRYLHFLFTWSDHSILRALINFNSKAVQLLNEFDSLLDTTNIPESYPIPSFSQDMIPSEGGDYTLLAIRCNRDLWQYSLQYVINMKSYIVEKCNITQHCLQLLAVRSDPTILYWTIPKCVVEIVKRNVLQCSECFYSQGILEVSVYPKQSLSTSDDIIIGSLAFICDGESTTMQLIQNSTSDFKGAKPQDKDVIKEKDEIKLKSWAEQVHREVFCAICLIVIEDSKTLSTCHHVFCGDCVKEPLQQDENIFKNGCPFCQAPFKEESQDYHAPSSPSSLQLHRLEKVWNEPMEKEVPCSICYTVIEETKVLSGCHHNFCRCCIEELLQKNKDIYKMECPICQAPFKREYVDSNFLLAFISEGESTTKQLMQSSASQIKAVRPQDKDTVKRKDVIKLESWAEQMDREVCCSMCLRIAKDSKTLSICHHVFCGNCVEELLQRDESILKKGCPICQALWQCNQAHPTVSSPSMLQLQNLIIMLGSSEERWDEQMEKEISCPICFMIFEEPKELSTCRHIFCESCIDELFQRDLNNYKVKCPICRAPFKRGDIENIFLMRRIVELFHEQQAFGTQRLPLLSHGGVTEPPLKSIDDNPTTNALFNQLADSMHKELQILVGNHAQILSALDTLEATKKDFQDKRDKDCEKVKHYFGRLRNILDGQEKNYLENLDEITTSALKMLGQQIHDLSDFESQLKSCNATLPALLQSANKAKIIKMERGVMLCVQDLNKSVEQCTLNPVCTPNTNVLYTNLENFAKTCESLCYVHSVPHPPNCAVLFVTDDVISVIEPVTVSVDLRDIHSKPVMNQAENLEVSSDQGDNFIVSTTVREVSPGIYDLYYFPKVRIAHRLDVNHNNIYQEKTVIVSTDVRSLQVCDLDMNRQRTIDTFAGKRFSRPCGLALGPNDEIVISDRSLHQLIVFGSDLQFHQVIGHKGSGNGEFSWPFGLYIDEAGFIYVADRKNNRVQKLQLNDGTFVSKIGKKDTGNGEFREPRAVALSKKEHLYVADGLNHRVQVFSEEKFIFSFGRPGNGPCEFDVPASIAFNKSEDVIFVSDNGNHRIQVFTIHGEYIQMFGDSSSPHKITLPHGIHRSRDGHILISCAGSNDILVFKEDGTFVKDIKDLIERPGEIAINSKGQIIAINHKGIVVSESSLDATPADSVS